MHTETDLAGKPKTYRVRRRAYTYFVENPGPVETVVVCNKHYQELRDKELRNKLIPELDDLKGAQATDEPCEYCQAEEDTALDAGTTG